MDLSLALLPQSSSLILSHLLFFPLLILSHSTQSNAIQWDLWHCQFSGLFITYLVLLEDIRDLVLDDLWVSIHDYWHMEMRTNPKLEPRYGITPCTLPPIDTVIDTAFEYRFCFPVLHFLIVTLKTPKLAISMLENLLVIKKKIKKSENNWTACWPTCFWSLLEVRARAGFSSHGFLFTLPW